jgi:anti-sigma B factor antagonist
MESFLIEVVEHPDNAATVARLKGSAGIGAADKVDQLFMRLVAKRTSLLVLDLSQMDFIATIGIGSFLRVQQDLGRHGGKLRLAAVQPIVWDVFKRCRLDTVFHAYDTVESAMAAE